MQLASLDRRDLDTLFGKDAAGKPGYQLADDPASLQRAREVTLFGREIFPWIMMLILVLVCVENVLANTFYREKTPARAVA